MDFLARNMNMGLVWPSLTQDLGMRYFIRNSSNLSHHLSSIHVLLYYQLQTSLSIWGHHGSHCPHFIWFLVDFGCPFHSSLWISRSSLNPISSQLVDHKLLYNVKVSVALFIIFTEKPDVNRFLLFPFPHFPPTVSHDM